MTPDSELLATFARTNSEDAFAELVKRHVNLVYSAALRQVNGDDHSAKDVAQTVFADLARKADSLARRHNLTGWLYTSAHFAAAKIIRTESRRRDREENFMRETTSESAPELDWTHLRPVLDAAMHELKDADREAILLRYFENRPFAEVGAKLGLNENAARMRVDRAVEKLRAILAERGLTAGATLASVISANAVQLAPAGLAATLTTASLLTAGTGTLTLLKIMTLTKLKIALSAVVVAGVATAFVVQHQAVEQLRTDRATLTQQLAQLHADNEKFSNRLAAAGNPSKLSDAQYNELMKLRGEVGGLRMQLTNVVLNYAKKVKQENQDKPETDPYEKQFRMKMGIGKAWVRAFCSYASQNQGQLPTSINQATQYLSGEANANIDIVNNPFEFVPSGLTNSNPGIILREQQPWYGAGNVLGRAYAWIRADGLQESFAFINEGDEKGLLKWEAQNQWEADYEHQQQQTTTPTNQ